jgi:hypothetical protein
MKKYPPLSPAMYTFYGFLIAVLLCWAIVTHGPDGPLWFFAGALIMGVICNLVNEKND